MWASGGSCWLNECGPDDDRGDDDSMNGGSERINAESSHRVKTGKNENIISVFNRFYLYGICYSIDTCHDLI
jgi:hypothetical protein